MQPSPVKNKGRAQIAETKYLLRKNGADLQKRPGKARELAWARRLATEFEERAKERANGTVARGNT